MICPLHRKAYPNENEGCPLCNKEGIIAISSEFDKQSRIIDTMTYLGNNFCPNRSRALLIFEKNGE